MPKNGHRFRLITLGGIFLLNSISFAGLPPQFKLSSSLTEERPIHGSNLEGTVESNQKSFFLLNFGTVPDIASHTILNNLFIEIRDERAWRWHEMPDFPRRLPWVYPSDGCYLRADLIAQSLKKLNVKSPKMIFIFGDLLFSSPYESISWWYHVAPLYRVGDELFVIDPSLDFYQPLPLKLWIDRLSANLENFQFSLCNAGAVSPFDDCSSEQSQWSLEDRNIVLQEYLASEWYNLEQQGFLVEKLLGDSPPWKK